MEDRNISISQEEEEIDLMELVKKFWAQRKFILMVCGIALGVGIVVAISIPKEYTTTVILAPESSGGGSGSMGALAAITGMNLTGGKGGITPELYPRIVESAPFLQGLQTIPVADVKQEVDTTLAGYLTEYQKRAWWSVILGLPGKFIGLFSSSEDELVTQGVPTPSQGGVSTGAIKLSRREAGVLSALEGRIDVEVEKKTGVITLKTTMQSPIISALIADTVVAYLQAYIIGYRTQKARLDLDYAQKLYDEAQISYNQTQQDYADYQDGNLGVISARYGVKRERMQQEMTLAYAIYNQMAQQLQMAKVKVQDETPVYTVIQPPVVPLKAAKPKKLLIMLGFVFLGFVGACGWIFLQDWLAQQKEKA
ncbi:chain-length determining protein [Bacteroidia bacterium]|nr:chain-length determining protein [Bacteroidia bacterium]